ncbi:MAG: hypothetical protein U1F43_16940 [Myxococcota bacterium]
MLRSLVVIASAASISAACPSDPSFVGTDADALVAGDSVSDSDGTADSVSGVDGSHLGPGLPCARDCLVQVTDQPVIAFDAVVDPDGRGVVALLQSVDALHQRLALRRYDGHGGWSDEEVAADLEDATRVAVGVDDQHALQLVVRAAEPIALETVWYHPEAGGGWAPRGVGIPGVGQQLLSDFHLWLACVDDDKAARFHVLHGADAPSGAWQTPIVLPHVGCVDGDGNVSIPAFGWSIDVLERPVVARQGCPPDIGLAYQAWSEEDGWSVKDLGRFASGPGATRRNVAMALEGVDRAHVLHQDVDDGWAILVDQAAGDPWTTATVDVASQAGGSLGELLAVAADTLGRLHLVYEKDKQLVYRYWKDGWSGPVTASVGVGDASRMRLAIDNQAPEVVFEDADGHLWWWSPAEAPAPE